MKEWKYPYSPTQLKAAFELKNMPFRKAAKEMGVTFSSLYDWTNGKAVPQQRMYEKVVFFLRAELDRVSTVEERPNETTSLQKIASVITKDKTITVELTEFSQIVQLFESNPFQRNLEIRSFVIGCLSALRSKK